MNDIHYAAPRKRFGQNFLVDANIIRRIIDTINPQKHETIIEIGPGRGALTDYLIDASNELHTVEIDKDLCQALRTRWPDRKNFSLHEGDALKMDYSELFHGDQLRVVGNLPYNISTPLLFHLLTFSPLIRDMHFMLQLELVERICAHPGSKTYGRLTVMINYYCKTRNVFTVPANAFYPPPKVNSAIIQLQPHTRKPIVADDENNLMLLVRDAFTQRRKTLANAIKKWLSTKQIKQIEIDPKIRPDQLSVAQFVKLSNHWYSLNHA